MNKFAIVYRPVFLILVLISCNKAEEFADVNFNTTLVESLPVTVISTNEMTASIVLDATTDPKIENYLGKIKKYEITELLFAIENYSTSIEDEIYFDGNIGFSKKSENNATTSCSISPLNITHVAGTGDFKISTCDAILTGISDVFTSDNAVKIYMTGAYTKAPLTFNLKVTVKVKVIANPL